RMHRAGERTWPDRRSGDPGANRGKVRLTGLRNRRSGRATGPARLASARPLREGRRMPDTTCHMSISLDGFVAGPDQSAEHALGKRGHDVHAWHMGHERATEADATAVEWLMRPRGAYVMGRNMFGPIRG